MASPPSLMTLAATIKFGSQSDWDDGPGGAFRLLDGPEAVVETGAGATRAGAVVVGGMRDELPKAVRSLFGSSSYSCNSFTRQSFSLVVEQNGSADFSSTDMGQMWRAGHPRVTFRDMPEITSPQSHTRLWGVDRSRSLRRDVSYSIHQGR